MKTRSLNYRTLGAAVIICIAMLTINSCKKDDEPGMNQVFMQNTAFNPSTITIAKNATVTWTNKDGFDHNVTSNDGSFASGNIGNGGTYSHQFTTSGTFTYRCTIHAGMTGTVVVQ